MYKIILIFLLASFGVMGQDLGIVDGDTLKKPKTGLTRLSEKAGKLFFRGATGTKKEIVSTNNSYANPSWIPSIALTKVTGLQDSLSNTVKKIAGKGLSTNDYTTVEKNKLAGIEDIFKVNQNGFPSWTDSDNNVNTLQSDFVDLPKLKTKIQNSINNIGVNQVKNELKRIEQKMVLL